MFQNHNFIASIVYITSVHYIYIKKIFSFIHSLSIIIMYSKLAEAAAAVTQKSHGHFIAILGGGAVAYAGHYFLYGKEPFTSDDHRPESKNSSLSSDKENDNAAGFHWIQSGTKTRQNFSKDITLGQRLSHFAIWVRISPPSRGVSFIIVASLSVG